MIQLRLFSVQHICNQQVETNQLKVSHSLAMCIFGCIYRRIVSNNYNMGGSIIYHLRLRSSSAVPEAKSPALLHSAKYCAKSCQIVIRFHELLAAIIPTFGNTCCVTRVLHGSYMGVTRVHIVPVVTVPVVESGVQ